MSNTEKKASPKESKTAAAPAAKLTREQLAILSVVQQERYNANELASLFSYLRKTDLHDFVTAIDVHIMHYLSVADEIAELEITGLYNLFALNRTLSEISGGRIQP